MSTRNTEMSSQYNAGEVEDGVYHNWEKSGFFNPDVCVKKKIVKKNAKPFSIVLPPPNVTGRLHMGHAAMLAIEDVLIRYHRMRGYKTLWLPGTDHAAIATQSRVESDMYSKEGKTRHDLGREEFLRRVEAFARESHDTIVEQIKKMGSSVDWSREAYTLDTKRSLAVRTAFTRMYDDGLIYRGWRLVNWDPKLQTTVSDDEIEWKEEKTPLYYLKYGPFIIVTARPETKFGDKYVVMHPDDARYKKYVHGSIIEVAWINGPVKATIIKDKAIDQEFGTGVMTITPWHDAVDYEIASRHGLDGERIIDLRGKLLPIAGEFSDMHIKKARPLIVEKLKEKGLIERVDDHYMHRVAINFRGGGMMEPQMMLQWFIDVNKKFFFSHSRIKGIKKGQKVSLKDLMRHVVKTKQIQIIPGRFEKIYFHWIANLRDWCISRQIWYGHRIPVWYKQEANHKEQTANRQNEKEKNIYVGIKTPKGDGWEQDADTLDTWFSSGLWTFSTLGWPHFAATATRDKPGSKNDLVNFHPTDVIETGYDILFFWVARMILMTGVNLGDIPFHKVYLHGMVRDGQGRKMSKSLGNIIDPLDMIARYGADATRLSLIIGAAPGNDIKVSEDRVRGYRNFANKIWNASRLLFMHLDTLPLKKKIRYTRKDKAALAKLAKLIKETTDDLEAFRMHPAAERLYHFFWHYYADKIIEEAKPRLNAPRGTAEQETAKALLLEFHTSLLRLLHPFMPFITEELWGRTPLKNKKLLMVEKWPTNSK